MDTDAANIHQRGFEETRVAMVLEAIGALDLKWELLDEHNECYGTRQLTFAAFREYFPRFPILLDAMYVGGISGRVQVAHLFRKFKRQFFSDYFSEALARHEAKAAGRAIGLLMPFGGLRGGIVIHNGSFETGGSKLVFPGVDDPCQNGLVVEPFRQLLKYLGRVGTELPRRSPPPSAAAVAPWMVRKLGTGPAVIVLGWLHTVKASNASELHKWIVRASDGERWIRATREQISAQTGLSVPAVKRGMTELRKVGLIYTVRGGGTTYIAIVAPELAFA